MSILRAKKEIVSIHKDKKGNPIVYANKGDILDLIADHVNILIVGKGSDRFHVRREDVEFLSS